MAEDKRANPFPFPTAAEVEAAGGSRAQKAARVVAVNKFDGIPRRAFLLGGNDHSPVMKSLVSFTEVVYELLDRIEPGDEHLADFALSVLVMMEDHGCPNDAPVT